MVAVAQSDAVGELVVELQILIQANPPYLLEEMVCKPRSKLIK